MVDEADGRDFLRGRVASYRVPRRVLSFAEDELTLRELTTRRLAQSENAF